MQQNRNLTEIERQHAEEMPLEEAVDRAIRECIREDVLREFLENLRAEAKEMIIFEYDQEKHMRQEREAAWEAGKTAGIEEGRRSGLEEGRQAGMKEGEEQILTLQIQKKLAKGKGIAEIAAELEETEDRIRQIMKKISN